MKVDPTLAAILMETNDGNRKIQPRLVDKYAKEMAAGRWKLTGQGISVYEDGDGTIHLINGQHRLLAVIKSGATVELLIIWETGREVFNVFDQGGNRTMGSVLGLKGWTEPNVVGALGVVGLLYEKHPDVRWNANRLLTRGETEAYIDEQDPDLIKQAISHHNALTKRKTAGFKTGTWYAGYAFLVMKHSAHGDRFLEMHEPLVHGAGMHRDDPRLALRNYLVNQQRPKHPDWARQVNVAIAIKAWNYHLAGVTREYLRFTKPPVPRIK